MKKIVALALSVILASLLLASCVESEDVSSVASSDESSATEQSATNKPWYETSVPDGYVSGGSSDDSSVSEEASQPDDSSLPDEESVPDEESKPDEEIVPENIGTVSGMSFSKSASAYRIAFTKTRPVVTLACVTNPSIKVTAQYDGSVTRFFNAIDGTYYFATHGKYLYACCDAFISGDATKFNGEKAIELEFDELGMAQMVETNHAHGYGAAVSFYSLSEKKAYIYTNDHSEGASLNVYAQNDYAICQSFTHDSSIASDWADDKAIDFEAGTLGKFGVVKNGKTVIDFEYDSIDSFADIGIFRAVKNGKTYYISSNGTNLTPEGFACGSEPLENRAWVYDELGQGYILEFR